MMPKPLERLIDGMPTSEDEGDRLLYDLLVWAWPSLCAQNN